MLYSTSSIPITEHHGNNGNYKMADLSEEFNGRGTQVPTNVKWDEIKEGFTKNISFETTKRGDPTLRFTNDPADKFTFLSRGNFLSTTAESEVNMLSFEHDFYQRVDLPLKGEFAFKEGRNDNGQCYLVKDGRVRKCSLDEIGDVAKKMGFSSIPKEQDFKYFGDTLSNDFYSLSKDERKTYLSSSDMGFWMRENPHATKEETLDFLKNHNFSKSTAEEQKVFSETYKDVFKELDVNDFNNIIEKTYGNLVEPLLEGSDKIPYNLQEAIVKDGKGPARWDLPYKEVLEKCVDYINDHQSEEGKLEILSVNIYASMIGSPFSIGDIEKAAPEYTRDTLRNLLSRDQFSELPEKLVSHCIGDDVITNNPKLASSLISKVVEPSDSFVKSVITENPILLLAFPESLQTEENKIIAVGSEKNYESSFAYWKEEVYGGINAKDINETLYSRLDDPSDKVTEAALQAVPQLITCFPHPTKEQIDACLSNSFKCSEVLSIVEKHIEGTIGFKALSEDNKETIISKDPMYVVNHDITDKKYLLIAIKSDSRDADIATKKIIGSGIANKKEVLDAIIEHHGFDLVPPNKYTIEKAIGENEWGYVERGIGIERTIRGLKDNFSRAGFDFNDISRKMQIEVAARYPKFFFEHVYPEKVNDDFVERVCNIAKDVGSEKDVYRQIRYHNVVNVFDDTPRFEISQDLEDKIRISSGVFPNSEKADYYIGKPDRIKLAVQEIYKPDTILNLKSISGERYSLDAYPKEIQDAIKVNIDKCDYDDIKENAIKYFESKDNEYFSDALESSKEDLESDDNDNYDSDDDFYFDDIDCGF